MGIEHSPEALVRLGQAIRQRRSEPTVALKTQTEFASRVGVHPVTIRYIEAGRRTIRSTTARRIETALHWQPGACDEILSSPDVDPRTFAQDPATAAEVAVAIARSALGYAAALHHAPPGSDTNEPLAHLLGEVEEHLTSLAEREFSSPLLEVLVDIRKFRDDIGYADLADEFNAAHAERRIARDRHARRARL